MSLSAHLLIRMTLVGLLCWFGVSGFVVWRLQQEGRGAIEAQADVLQRLTEQQLRRQLVAQDAGGRLPDLARVVALYGRPVCLRYQAIDQPLVQWGCEPPVPTEAVPGWLAAWLGERLPLSVTRGIRLWSREDGVLRIEPQRAAVIEQLWSRLQDLTSLTAATIAALDLLVWLVLRRLLQPTVGFVSALDRLGEGEHSLTLPRQGAREFRRLSEGIQRLAGTLAQLTAIRATLTSRLIDTQEAERREIAHDLHDEMGQCIAALQAVSSGIRQSAAVGEPATIEDTEILDATVNELAAGVRSLLVRLRPPLLDEQGLQWALQDLVSAWNLRQRAARQPPLRAELTLPTQWPAELDEATSLGLYRACQEALTNAARYADAREPVRLSVALAHGRLRLAVRNACSSSLPARGASGTGLGLGMMAERVRARGGDLHAAREPAPAGDAFVLTLQWPLRPVPAHA